MLLPPDEGGTGAQRFTKRDASICLRHSEKGVIDQVGGRSQGVIPGWVGGRMDDGMPCWSSNHCSFSQPSCSL